MDKVRPRFERPVTGNETEAMKQTSTFPCRGAIHILGDEPAGTDELGAHEALAQAIARLITNEQGGKAIALEGGWGGGKSTVVSLLKRKLADAHRGRVFVFDGWAHEGDSLRRALVEEFAVWAKGEEKADGQPLVPREIWKRLDPKIEELQRRRTKQKSKATHRLTAWGRVMVVLITLVPVGAVLAAWLRGKISELALVFTGLPAALLFLIAILAALTWGLRRLRRAGAVGFRASIRAFCRDVIVRTRKWFSPTAKASPWKAFDDVLGIFLRQVKERVRARAWNTPEPSSIEFEIRFRQVLTAVLGCTEPQRPGAAEEQQTAKRSGDETEKLLIVLDNLDRLPAEEATRAFATLRIFLENRKHEEWMKRLWLLVPYDAKSLRASPREYGASDESAQVIEDSFLEKFFQARFRLPQPVLLKWRKYLKDRLKEVLEGHADEADGDLLDGVVRLFEQARKNDLITPLNQTKAARYAFPTPREIKLFVNRVATLHMQWPCEKAGPTAGAQPEDGADGDVEHIPLILQAGFALCETRVKDDLSALIHPALGNQNALFHDDELRQIGVKRWERHVAAMWYGVPQDEALHMLLRPRVLDAFGVGVVRDHWNQSKMPYEVVRESGSLGTSGFWNVVPAAAREFIGPSDNRTLERCAGTLAVLAKWRDEKQPWHDGWKAAWEAVAQDTILALSNERARMNREAVLWSGENFAIAVTTPEADPDLAKSALTALAGIEHVAREEDYISWANQAAALLDAMAAKGKPEWAEGVNRFRAPQAGQRPALPLIFLLGAAYGLPRLKYHVPAWANGHEVPVTESMAKAFGDTKPQAPPNLPLLYHAQAFDLLAWAPLLPYWGWGPVVDVLPEWLAAGKFPPSVLIPLAHGLLGLLGTYKLRDLASFDRVLAKRGHIQHAISKVESFLQPTANPNEKQKVPEATELLKGILNLLDAQPS